MSHPPEPPISRRAQALYLAISLGVLVALFTVLYHLPDGSGWGPGSTSPGSTIPTQKPMAPAPIPTPDPPQAVTTSTAQEVMVSCEESPDLIGSGLSYTWLSLAIAYNATDGPVSYRVTVSTDRQTRVLEEVVWPGSRGEQLHMLVGRATTCKVRNLDREAFTA